MIVKDSFSSSCKEGAGEKVKGNRKVNLDHIFLTSKRNYRANSPVDLEEDTFPCYEYCEVPDGSGETSILPTSSVNRREDSPVSSEGEYFECNGDNEISDDSREKSIFLTSSVNRREDSPVNSEGEYFERDEDNEISDYSSEQSIFLPSSANRREDSLVSSEREYFECNGDNEISDDSREKSIFLTSSVNHREDSPVSSEYFECNEDNEISDDSSEEFEDFLPTEEQKFQFFKLLKRLLEDPCLLREGMKRKCQCNQDILKLVYLEEKCEVIIEDSSRCVKWRHTLKTRDIYLKWRYDHVETLSVENLQKVENELGFLNIQSNELKACFSSARINFNNELASLQKNTKLIICHDDVSLTFVSGKGENRANILYDDNKSKPDYTMEVAHFHMKIARWIYQAFCWVDEFLGNLTGFKDLCNAIAQLIRQKIRCDDAKYKTQ